jgi:hypothetical protein
MQHNPHSREIELFDPTARSNEISDLRLTTVTPAELAQLQDLLTEQQLRRLEWRIARHQRDLQQSRHDALNNSVNRLVWGLGVASIAGMFFLFFLAAMVSMLRPPAPPAPQINPNCIVGCGGVN